MKNTKLRKALDAYTNNKGLSEEDAPIILDNAYYDNSIIGITADNRLVYSKDKMIKEYMQDEECDEEDAIEWLEYNTLRAIPYFGKQTPIVVKRTSKRIVLTRKQLLEQYGK